MLKPPSESKSGGSVADFAAASEAARREGGVAPVAAAKLHVLHLEPIQEKLGARWSRLSDLVHKLFEKALHRAQGPHDHFIAVGELSYVVTFHALSVDEASLACAAIAREVCALLFGDGIDDMSVRALVGTVPASAVFPPVDGKILEAMLELSGRESVYRPAPPQQRPAKPAFGRSDDLSVKAEGMLRVHHRRLGTFPVWDLQNLKSHTTFIAPQSLGADKTHVTVRRLLDGSGEAAILEAEIALLEGAGEYARWMKAAGKLCAVSVGVSYVSLSGFYSRIRYIGALKATVIPPTIPFLLKIEQVPQGTPLGRLGEMVAMLQGPNQRILIEFSGPPPELDVRLGAHGIGAVLADHCSVETAEAVAQKLARQAIKQKAFAFLTGLANAGLVAAATRQNIRFGMGSGLGRETQHLVPAAVAVAR